MILWQIQRQVTQLWIGIELLFLVILFMLLFHEVLGGSGQHQLIGDCSEDMFSEVFNFSQELDLKLAN